MKKIIVVTFFLCGFYLYLGNNNPTYALTCECSAEPTNPPINESFQINGRACDVSEGQINISIWEIMENGEQSAYYDPQLTPITNGAFSFNVPAIGKVGTFLAIYTDGTAGGAFDPKSCGNFTTRLPDNPTDPENPAGLICGTQTATYSPNCPSFCPSVLVTTTKWECKWDPPEYLCDSTSGLGINTAIGCIPVGVPEKTVAFLLRWSLGVAGGLAILVFIAAGFQFITSSGNPEKINSAKEMLMAGIVGVLMIVLSVFLLRVIGFNILGIF